MALEPAGISLRAENFNRYIKQLGEIEKAHQRVFNVDPKPLIKGFSDVEKAAKKFTAETKRTKKASKEAGDVFKQLQNNLQLLATTGYVVAAVAAARFVKSVTVGTLELGRTGASFQALRIGLDNLAASYGQSGRALQEAIIKGSRGAISEIQALQTANEGLLLEVAKTPEEFEKFAKVALTLGRSVGISATEAIKRFTTALGRESLLRLDDFGIKAIQINEEIKKLADRKLGKLPGELTKVERSAIFLEAAMKIIGENVDIIGDEAADAVREFERLDTAAENLKTTVGEALSDLNQEVGFTKALAKEINDITEGIIVSRSEADKAALKPGEVFRGGEELAREVKATEINIKRVKETIDEIGRSLAGERTFSNFFGLFAKLDKPFNIKALQANERQLEELEATLRKLKIRQFAADIALAGNKQRGQADATEQSVEALRAYENALRQAERLQLNFARQAEDSARDQARALEDLALNAAREAEDVQRRSGRRQAKLAERQANEREELLRDQQRELDKFERDRVRRIAEAEEKANKERRRAAEERKRDQEKLHRELRQATERFQLSVLQNERRFQLEDLRLRAEGDVLGLKELRENRALERLEEKENFDLAQKQRIEDAKGNEKDRSRDAREEEKDRQDRISKLKRDLDNQRKELLISFDQQFADQVKNQADARAELLQTLAERREDRIIADQRAAEDRAIALAREEEDRRISYQRQLEDLGRSLATQKDVTAEGALAIASEIEKIFGKEGVADTIFTGFTERTESAFEKMFDDIADIVEEAEKKTIIPTTQLGGGTIGGDRFKDERGAGTFQRLQEGGIVGGQGPIGSPQVVVAHKGETVLPTHKQSFSMNAPVVPSQNLNVVMSGGFDITGGEQAGEEVIQAAVAEMTTNMEIAIRRIARRSS